MELERLTLEEWGNALPTTGFEVFHTPEALSVIDDHAEAELQLFGGFKGQQVVALLPLFVRRTTLGPNVVSSPPLSVGVPYLGPLVMPSSPKQKKQERLNQRFTDAILDEIDAEESRTVFRILCSPGYDDPRPYIWSDVESSPRFTYRLDFEGLSSEDLPSEDPQSEELLSQFSPTLRSEIRRGRDLGVTVEQGDLSDARQIHEEEVSGSSGPDTDSALPWEYVRDLITGLGDRARVYAARGPNGSYLSGAVVLYSNDTVYYWQGGEQASYDGVNVTPLLHHRILADAVGDPPFDSVTRYDFVGANPARPGGYESQFGGDLVRYYHIESDDATAKLAKRAYQWFDTAGLKG